MKKGDIFMEWDYAELSKAAKAAGGPEKFVDSLIAMSKEQGKSSMYPLVLLAFVSGGVLTYSVHKLVSFVKSKKTKGKKAIEEARQEIIDGIKEYDSTYHLEETKLPVTETPE